MLVLPLAVAVFGAVFFMNNLTADKSTFKDQLAIVGRKHTWIMSYIYIGTFGSFIGYSAAFPLLIKTQFPSITVAVAFLGPLVGSLARPFGGLLADKVGGAIVTFWNFIAMAAATIGVLYFVDIKDFTGFLAMFLILFVTTGIGNGSTYRMIPSIFREEKLRDAKAAAGEAGRAVALKAAGIEAAAALGFIGAIGACGGYLIFADEDRLRAMALVRWLNDSGWRVVADDRHAFAPGDRWSSSVRLNSCDVMLCLITPGWLVSRFCHDEYAHCASHGKFVL